MRIGYFPTDEDFDHNYGPHSTVEHTHLCTRPRSPACSTEEEGVQLARRFRPGPGVG